MNITKDFIINSLEDLIGQPITEHLQCVIIKRLRRILWNQCEVVDDRWDNLLKYPELMHIRIGGVSEVVAHGELSNLTIDVWGEMQ